MHDPDSQTSPASLEPEKNTLIAAADYLRAGIAAMCQGGDSRRRIFEAEKSLLREWSAQNGSSLTFD